MRNELNPYYLVYNEIHSLGSGKTTIIKKLVEDLNKLSFQANGFYTEEVRDGKHERLGFDIFAFNGAQGILARSRYISIIGKILICFLIVY
jgi:nucleoside-triphosphatase THEP1